MKNKWLDSGIILPLYNHLKINDILLLTFKLIQLYSQRINNQYLEEKKHEYIYSKTLGYREKMVCS